MKHSARDVFALGWSSRILLNTSPLGRATHIPADRVQIPGKGDGLFEASQKGAAGKI